VAREEKNFLKYNGLLALAELERATIITLDYVYSYDKSFRHFDSSIDECRTAPSDCRPTD